MTSRSFSHRIGICWLLILVAGCLPSEPQWLPDGSGLVYTKPGDEQSELTHLDLTAGKTRRMAMVGDSRTSPVGVSPTGDRVALLKRNGKANAQVIVADLEGNLVHTSPEFTLGDKEFNEEWDAISWSPFDDHLFLWLSPPRLYHLKTGEFEILHAEHPSLSLLAFRVSPFLPDGTGLILEREVDEGPPQFVFCNWQGELRSLKFADGVRPEQFESQQNGEMQWWPPAGRWQDNVARLPLERGYMLLDPQRGLIDFEPSEMLTRACEAAKKDKWSAAATFSDPMQRLVARRLGREHFTVEWFSHPAAAPKVILSKVRAGYPDDNQPVTFFPSPEGDKIAIKYRQETKDGVRIMVVNRQGGVIYDGEL